MTDIPELAAALGNELSRTTHRLVTAESCTGGGIARALTGIIGASHWFDCGFVAYSNASKTRILQVPEALIQQYGAASGEVAAAMAKGALAVSDGTISIATTGIAGPDGAMPSAPVGTIWFGLTANNRIHTEKQLFSGNRQAVQDQSVRHALAMLLQFLQT